MSNIAYLPSARAMDQAAPNMQGYQVEAEEEYKAPYGLDDLVAMFEDAEEATEKARRISERCRDYYDNKQLTSEEIAELQSRGQPEIVRNQIKGKVNFWLGFEAKNRSDPRAEAEHGTAEEAASDATDMLRFQERRNELDQKFSDVWENMLIEGYGGVEVLGPSRKDKRVIEIKRWKWDRLFYDPASCEHDFSDATYLGGVVWMDGDAAKRRWPNAKGAIEASVTAEVSLSRTYDDKPRQHAWATRNGKRTRVRIVQMYYVVDEQWHWCVFTKGGMIESGPVELIDEQGNSVCPMILQALYIDRDNQRYGEVMEFLWTQDEINKRASKALHLANSSLTIGEEGAGLDIDHIKAQKARPDGHISLPPGTKDKFEFVEHDVKVAQNREMMNDAVLAIEKRGPNAALMGTQTTAPSGRAIRANQEGGMIEGARPRDRYNALKARVYKALWQRCRQFCDEETWIAVTDDEQSIRHVGFNRRITMAEKLAEEGQRQGMEEEEIAARLEMLAQDPMNAAQLSEIVVVNVPTEIDVNIIIEPVTESVTMAQEAFEFIAGDPNVPFELKLELWPGSARQKKRIRDKLEKLQASRAKAEAQAEALKADNVKADTEGKRARAMKDMAQADHTAVQAQVAPVQAAHGMARADADAMQRERQEGAQQAF